jgi:S1/P1 Nuclease
MKKKLFILSVALGSVALISWGTFGHEHINKAAVLSLPKPMQSFFYNHIDFVTQEASVPDLRKYTLSDKAENPRHFIDLENFGSADSLPKTLAEVKSKYDEKFVQQNGILPWYIQEMMDKLTKSFKEKRKTEILFVAADLGHYIGDAHMPLHTSANHDGQMTNQKGIHSLWESRIPEVYGSNYKLNAGETKFIDNIEKETWAIITHSHKLKDTLLMIDKKLRESTVEEKILQKGENGKPLRNKFGSLVFTDEYTKKLNEELKGMVERQMRASVIATANFWYTAWVNAGKPDLSDLDSKELSDRSKPMLEKELELFKKGKLFGVESEKEY